MDWATSDATALAGSDYAGGSGSLTLTSGQTTATLTVTVTGDLTYEPTEAFHVDLSNPGGATIADGLGVGTITNDDPLPSVSVSDASVFEGDSGPKGADFAVTLSNPSYQSDHRRLGHERRHRRRRARLRRRERHRDLRPRRDGEAGHGDDIGDTLDENERDLHGRALQRGVRLDRRRHRAPARSSTTTDPSSISVNDVAVGEGNLGTTPLAFTVSLDYPSGKPVSVDWTARRHERDGRIRLHRGERHRELPAGRDGEDHHAERDGRRRRSRPTRPSPSTCPAPMNATVNDGHGRRHDHERRCAAHALDRRRHRRRGQRGHRDRHVPRDPHRRHRGRGLGRLGHRARARRRAGSDFSTGGATLNFAPGDTSKTIDVSIHGDTTFEPDETYAVDLSAAAGATLADAQGVGTIHNDDKQITKLKAAVAKTKKGLLAKGTLTGGAATGCR